MVVTQPRGIGKIEVTALILCPCVNLAKLRSGSFGFEQDDSRFLGEFHRILHIYLLRCRKIEGVISLELQYILNYVDIQSRRVPEEYIIPVPV